MTTSSLPPVPHNLEAEYAVIGCLLTENSSLDSVEGLAPEHFFDPTMRACFAEASAQIGAGTSVDVLTLYSALRESPYADGLLALLNACAQTVSSTRHARRYADLVIERYADRQLRRIGIEIAEASTDPSLNSEAKVLNAQEALGKVRLQTTGNEPSFASETLAAHIELLERRSRGEDVVLPTGIDGLDRTLNGGARPGQVIVIGARPSMGKTTLALTIARHNAALPDTAVLVLSMEMPEPQLHDANIAALGHLPLDRILNLREDDNDAWARIVDGADRLSKLNLMIDATAALRLVDVRSKILAAKRKSGGKLRSVVVDYLQLMAGEGENRNSQLDAISNGIKALALQHGLVIYVLSQCNREADKKPGGASDMSDLRDSGAIEAAADTVFLVHREHHRNPQQGTENYGEVRVPKNRFGRTGRVPVYFDGALQYFGHWTGPSPILSGSGNTGGARRVFNDGLD